MLKNKLTVFFGIFLVSMLFVPPSIPFMVPEADAADTTPPVVTVPSDQTFTTQSGQKDYSFQTSATDNVGVTSSDCKWHYNESVAGDPSGWYGTFSIGTSTITCTATDAAGNVGTNSFTVTVLLDDSEAVLTELTLNPVVECTSPNSFCTITESSDYVISQNNWAGPKVKYDIGGSSHWSTPVAEHCKTVQILKPDGTEASIIYGTSGTGADWNSCSTLITTNSYWGFPGYINDAFNASGWTAKVCIITHGVTECAEQNFTINFAFLDGVDDGDTTPDPTNCNTLSNNSSLEDVETCLGGSYSYGGGLGAWDGISASAYLNSTSPTGRTLQVTANNIVTGTLITFIPQTETADGNFVSFEFPSSIGEGWQRLGVGYSTWQIPIPTNWGTSDTNYASGEELRIFWRLSTWPTMPYAIMIGGNNIDGLTNPITLPALPSGYVPPTQGSNPPLFTIIAPPQSGGGGLQTPGVAEIDFEDYVQMGGPWTTEYKEYWKAVNEGGNLSMTVYATNSTGKNIYFTPEADFYPYHPDGYMQNDGSSTQTCSTPNNADLSGNNWYYTPLFPIGSTTVTCTVTDTQGNTGTVSFTVNVILQESAAVLSFYSGWAADGYLQEIVSGDSLTVQATNSTGQNAYFQVSTAVDFRYTYWWGSTTNITCSASPEPTYTTRDHYTGPKLEDDPSSWWRYGPTFPIGDTTVTCTGIDEDGNTGTASLTVTVNAPFDTSLIVTVPPDFTAYATNSTGQSYHMLWAAMGTNPLYSGIVEFTKCDGSNVGLSSHGDWKFYAIPVCDSSGNLINTSYVASSGCSPAYDTLLPIGTNTITCTATDTAGNTGTASFTVTVNAPPETAAEIVIPSWIKNNAGWWASNQIDDRSFVSGLQWLITNGVMHIPPTEQGAGSDDVIPGWIKNNAGWWADGLIDDRNFVGGIQWLITNGIMVIG